MVEHDNSLIVDKVSAMGLTSIQTSETAFVWECISWLLMLVWLWLVWRELCSESGLQSFISVYCQGFPVLGDAAL